MTVLDCGRVGGTPKKNTADREGTERGGDYRAIELSRRGHGLPGLLARPTAELRNPHIGTQADGHRL
jgi:hypothetical protein